MSVHNHILMLREQLPRIRLKVSTNIGINILCTANRNERVVDWLPHFEQAYRQVKEEQQDDQSSIQKFIKALRIKKGQFYIANSEIIGDVFDDNDSVQCQIAVPNNNKSKNKRTKANTKYNKDPNPTHSHNEINKDLHESPDKQDEEFFLHQQQRKIPKNQLFQHLQQQQTLVAYKKQTQTKNKKNSDPQHLSIQPLHTQPKQPSPKVQKVDLNRLKSLIVRDQPIQRTPKTIQQQ